MEEIKINLDSTHNDNSNGGGADLGLELLMNGNKMQGGQKKPEPVVSAPPPSEIDVNLDELLNNNSSISEAPKLDSITLMDNKCRVDKKNQNQ